MKHRLHVLALPHTVSTPEYSSCAFTSKVVKLCKMLTASGHEVVHYGHADSRVAAAEHVAVTDDGTLRAAYGHHDWRTSGFPPYRLEDPAHRAFRAGAIREVAKRKRPGDFLLCAFGAAHKSVAEAHPDLIAVEPGIGYPGGSFANFRVFESYAVLHATHGLASAARARNDFWYDAVIPNFFDEGEFEPRLGAAGGHLLFLGRLSEAKGAHIAAHVAEELGVVLLAAGQGDPRVFGGRRCVDYRGVVGPAERRALLAGAGATLCPSTFLEPFCGVQVESYLSGTPVVSSDWGAFAEYNLHGVTGYRCRTFEQFTWAARACLAGAVERAPCRAWGLRFSLAAVAPMYEEYFDQVTAVFGGRAGWYEPKPGRRALAATSFGPATLAGAGADASVPSAA